MFVGCDPSTKDLKAVEYAPLTGDDWKVSTPAEQGLDPMLVAELGYNAANLETIYGLLVIKNSYLIAERYFNSRSQSGIYCKCAPNIRLQAVKYPAKGL